MSVEDLGWTFFLTLNLLNEYREIVGNEAFIDAMKHYEEIWSNKKFRKEFIKRFMKK